MSRELYGLVATFASPESFLRGLRAVRENGYSDVEANVPFAVEGMDEWLPGRPTPIARVVLAAALAGAGFGYFLQWYAVHDYPINVGGRPLNSWPAFIPVTFELTVLFSALAGVAALLWLTGLPRLHHAFFQFRDYERASQDRFIVCLRSQDPRFDLTRVRELFGTLGAESVTEAWT